MFEISVLKEKKIAELQEIASNLGINKITGLKKIDLAYKIIDHYAANPDSKKEDKKPEKKYF
jgi:transcription termination factor Rho